MEKKFNVEDFEGARLASETLLQQRLNQDVSDLHGTEFTTLDGEPVAKIAVDTTTGKVVLKQQGEEVELVLRETF